MSMDSNIAIYDIRGDKSEQSLLGMLREGLVGPQKTIPTLLLYDERGLKLFEKITYLDEYYLTNAEIEVLTKHAAAIAEHVPANSRIIELGSGNLRKVNILLEAFEEAHKSIEYFALDLSLSELHRTFEALDTSKFRYVSFNGFHGTYDDGLAWLSRSENQNKINCVISLGSSIGNFSREDAAQFLLSFSKVMKPSDRFIVSFDATTDRDLIFHAYNDSEGVTEQFYRNGLDHANELLGYEAFKQGEWSVLGEYIVSEHKHMASYVALKDIQNKDFRVHEGEKLSLEHAFKFDETESDALWHRSGLIPLEEFTTDQKNHRLVVLRPAAVQFATGPIQYAARPVPAIEEWQQLWTVWDAVTKSMIPREELMNKPIQLRNNLIFYLGHIPTFADIHYTKATGSKPCDPAHYYSIFERGIDPDVDNPEVCHAHSEIPDTWPPLQEILTYQLHVRQRITESIESGLAARDSKLARGLWLAFEHEAMHLETFIYMLLQSDKVLAPPGQQRPDFEALAKAAALERTDNIWHTIPAGDVVLGADDPENNLPPERYFLWDNERPARRIHIDTFKAQSRPISIGEYARYLESIGSAAVPASWVVEGARDGSEDDHPNSSSGRSDTKPSPHFMKGKTVRSVYGPLPLEWVLDWPVMASYDELAAFAEWSDGRIPTLEELKGIYNYVETQQAPENTSSLIPAVNGHLSNDGVEETPPPSHFLQKAGEDASSNLDPTNLFLDLQGCNVGFKFWHPTPVTGSKRLRGQADAGGLWEWSSTRLAAFEGFKPMDLYPGYTADFFDNKHNICLGGSWATVPRIAGRKSFVNWYQYNYPYVWCTARLVRDIA